MRKLRRYLLGASALAVMASSTSLMIWLIAGIVRVF
jgi:hypothetical protein